MANIVVNGFTVGTELQSVILFSPSTGASFPVEQLGHLEELGGQAQNSKVTISPCIYGGKRLHRNIYHDYAGRMTFTRYNGNITQLVNEIVQRFQSSGFETYFSIFATVFNSVLNTEDEYLYNQCVLDDHDMGTYTGTKEVTESLAFRCQTLTITGSITSLLTPV